ncbi:MAG: hypothetical protein K2O88_01110 [Paramuribaculum sp.]|nr:hypothetical protein [Paramuribaculum sp.]
MKTKWLLFKIIIAIQTICTPLHVFGTDWRTLHSGQSGFVPSQAIIQYAGNMGALSIGTSWNYGKNKQWETDLCLGYVPKGNTNSSKATITIRENYVPWFKHIGNSHIYIEPLTCSIFLNTIFGDNFWQHQPNRYPEHYYEKLSTKTRVHIAFGQRIELELAKGIIRSIGLYYEFNTYDLRIRSLFQGEGVKFSDLWSLAIGFRCRF